MTSFYQAFLSHHIDLTPLGMDLKAKEAPYPCTPKGASILGWSGVDGIHYCRIRGWGETVFAVEPARGAAGAVHPLAWNFRDLLRLLLYAGSMAALENAWRWDDGQWAAYCREHPPGEAQRAVLARIAKEMGLSPMEEPWRYIRRLQAEFDASAFASTDQPPAGRPAPWRVYFHGGFGSGARYERAGREIPVEKRFQWLGGAWYIPSVYACGAGLVMDILRRVPAREILAFMARWQLTADAQADAFTAEEQLLMEAGHPFRTDYYPCLRIEDGAALKASQGCGICWNPIDPERNDRDAGRALRHYGLEPQDGWSIMRWRFPWPEGRRMDPGRLAVTLSPGERALPGPRFSVAGPGDHASFTDPVSGGLHRLTVRCCEAERLDPAIHRGAGEAWPGCFTVMGYTVDPPLPEGRLVVMDTAGSDPPRPQPGQAHSACCAVGIIGGASCPTVLGGGEDGPESVQYAASALHYTPAGSITWRMVFYQRKGEDRTVDLL